MDWAIFAISLALSLATAVLAWFTWGLWRETKAARRPRVVASLDLFPPSHGELRFVNAGSGAAFDVHLTFSAEGGEQRRWVEPVVMPGDGQNFHLLSQADLDSNPDATSLDSVARVFPTLTITGGYDDVRGETYGMQQTLDIGVRWNEAKHARQLAAFRGPLLPFYESLQSISDAVLKIADRG